MGSKRSGLTTHAAGWQGAIRVHLWHDETDGTDRYSVSLTPWKGSGGSTQAIAEGILDAARAGGMTLLPGAWGSKLDPEAETKLTDPTGIAVATCVECGRVFDLGTETDSQEWTYGHDCEA
jgi:hypothetical protein